MNNKKYTMILNKKSNSFQVLNASTGAVQSEHKDFEIAYNTTNDLNMAAKFEMFINKRIYKSAASGK